MKDHYLNIYNNLIKLTRNKILYEKLEKQDTFSERLTILFFHFGFFLKYYKSDFSRQSQQELFDFVIHQIELSIREIGYGDVTVNKKMKQYVNLFYSILGKIEVWDRSNYQSKMTIISNYLDALKNIDFYANYFEKYRIFLSKNTLNTFTKDIINFKF